MIDVLAANKQALETELQERIQTFFQVNNKKPNTVSIEMKLSKTEQVNGSSTIKILVKDKCTDQTLITV
ncbi:hypothetical protein [Leucothrix pacifica]|uniref:Uncharacterized protein n=1 Tax=Leucothrix pacifica TaxID=1247513 RepID=A0A317C3Q1_9GAMM|nr:hypothetical protein [Leucothrix pacifica]PWQ92927.1 hypothetical protein DKW60_18635 [Leucothrix pacifica]